MPARADTLEEAVLQAYENNPGVELSRALARANQEGVVQAEAAYGPTLSASLSHRYTFRQTHIEGVPIADNEGFGTSAALSLAQPIFTSGRLAAGLDLATATALGSREDLRDSSQQLILNVIVAYVSLQRDIELYQVAGDIYQLLQQQNEITVSRLELRDATAPDVDQTDNRMQFAAARVVQARAAVEASAAAYRALVGEYPAELAPLPPLPQLPPLEQLYELAEMGHPQLLSARYTEIASQAQLAGARAQRGPRVDANLSAGRSPLGSFANDPYGEELSAALTLSMPLYSGGFISAGVRDALQRNIAAQQNLEQTRRSVRQSLATDWNLLQGSEMAIPRYVAAVSAAERAVDGIRQQQTAGLRTLRDVLETTNDLFTARSAAVQAQADRYIQHAAVLRDAGILTIDLFAPGAEYDPRSYQPSAAWGAGLPLKPVLDPLDSLLVSGSAPAADVQVEDDLRYEQGAQLEDPLVP